MLKMKDITIGMRLEDERTNTVFTVIEKNSKYKTVMLQAEDGTTRSTSIATIGKHFVEVVEIEDLTGPVEEQEEIKEEQVVDTEEVVETEEDEITTWTSKKKLTWKEMLGAFIEKAPKKKNEDKEKAKVEQEQVKSDFTKLFEEQAEKAGLVLHKIATLPNLVTIKVGKKTKAELRLGRKGYRFDLKEDIAPEGYEYGRTNNYYLPLNLKGIPYDDIETMKTIVEAMGA